MFDLRNACNLSRAIYFCHSSQDLHKPACPGRIVYLNCPKSRARRTLKFTELTANSIHIYSIPRTRTVLHKESRLIRHYCRHVSRRVHVFIYELRRIARGAIGSRIHRRSRCSALRGRRQCRCILMNARVILNFGNSLPCIRSSRRPGRWHVRRQVCRRKRGYP